MTDRDFTVSVLTIAASAITFIISAFVSIARTNLGIEQGAAFTVAVVAFALGMATLLRLSWKFEKAKERN